MILVLALCWNHVDEHSFSSTIPPKTHPHSINEMDTKANQIFKGNELGSGIF